jgi:hypothetical protein
VQALPAAHETQAPPAQTEPVPQLAPSATLPLSVHVAIPALHVTVPVWHPFAGTHTPPEAQERKSHDAATVPSVPQSVVKLPWMKSSPFTCVPTYDREQRVRLIPSVSNWVAISCEELALVEVSVQVSPQRALMPQRKFALATSATLRSRLCVGTLGTQTFVPNRISGGSVIEPVRT